MSWTRIKSGGWWFRRPCAGTPEERRSHGNFWPPAPFPLVPVDSAAFSCLLLRVRLLRFLFIASPFVWYTDGCLIVAQNSGDPSLYAYLYVRSTGTAELWA
jgi:hypothetical protein